MFLQHYVTFPFFPTQISGGPRNRQYHQLSLGQAPHDAKGIHHLQQINPGRSLVGICYIPAVGKGLRTYRFRRPSPGIVVYPEMGLIPARAPPLTSSGSSRQCYHLLPLQLFAQRRPKWDAGCCLRPPNHWNHPCIAYVTCLS